MRIIIAEDEPDVAEYLGLLLTRFGHELRVTSDGTEAVAVAPSFQPDLLITDWNMPGMDGLAVAHHMMCKTILISARPEAELVTSGNIVGFLKKPIRAHELLGMLKSLASSEPARPSDSVASALAAR